MTHIHDVPELIVASVVLWLAFLVNAIFVVCVFFNLKKPDVFGFVLPLLTPMFALKGVCAAISAVLLSWNAAQEMAIGGPSVCMHYQAVFEAVRNEATVFDFAWISIARYLVVVKDIIPSSLQLLCGTSGMLGIAIFISIGASILGWMGPLDSNNYAWCGMQSDAAAILVLVQVALCWIITGYSALAVAQTRQYESFDAAATAPAPRSGHHSEHSVSAMSFAVRLNGLMQGILVSYSFFTVFLFVRVVVPFLDKGNHVTSASTTLYTAIAVECMHVVNPVVATFFFVPGCLKTDMDPINTVSGNEREQSSLVPVRDEHTGVVTYPVFQNSCV